MIIDEEDYLEHYGTPRHSGRYPWGSGDSPKSRDTFLGMVEDLKNKGLSDAEIAKGLGMESSTELRRQRTIARAQKKQEEVAMAKRLQAKGYSNVAIGKRMGKPESSVRALLKEGAADKANILYATANMLREQVDKKKYVDVGIGVERQPKLGISKENLAAAVSILVNEGYTLHTNIKVKQLGTGKLTDFKILARPGTEWKEVARNKDNIQQITDFSDDGGRTWSKIQPPLSISSKRVAIRYGKDGGNEADGVIYVRPGVKDVTLDGSRYAQVRIAVDGSHYLKGMAVYKDDKDFPPGVDLIFNTNKNDTGNKLDAMKEMKKDKDGNLDKDNPFGSAIDRQIGDKDPSGRVTRLTSVMNLVNEEGKWDTWSKNLSSQMLSKQSPKLAKTQLDLTYEKKRNELDRIKSLTNPAIKRKLLEAYAEGADSSAVHLKAAALPRQRTHVILPVNTLKETEVYAPNFNNGERVVLIRYPHGGVFEIPELTVNNKHPQARKIIGTDAPDAIGISHKVAERLSGADFDGDTVLVIPNNRGDIKTKQALDDLKGFDPQARYPKYEGMSVMTARQKGLEMGDISNLITDMTIKRASWPEIARAVKHSMVVIDAEKHQLNWKQSAIDNGIADLKRKYQGGSRSGASTLISRATSETRVLDRKLRRMSEGGPIDEATGRLVYTPTGATDTRRVENKKTGEVTERQEPRKIKSVKLAETDDAHTLSSGTVIEKIYADHSNRLKGLANEARLESLSIKNINYSPSARKIYAKEVETLNAALNLALKNAPLERQAQVIGNAIFNQKKKAYPDMDKDEIKKVKFMALEEARSRVGAGKELIKISDREWEAIQAGAITNHKLKEILDNADLDRVKELATPPKSKLSMPPAKIQRAQALLDAGYTQAEVAGALGVSISTLANSIKSSE